MDQAAIIEANPLAASILTKARSILTEPCGLALVLVGDDPYSHRMLDFKIEQAKAIGVTPIELRFPQATSQAVVLDEIVRLNRDPSVHGIFIQAPLPKQFTPSVLFEALDPAKDVDGYHPLNLGRLAMGGSGFVPCAPLGAVMMLKDRLGDLSGRHAVVVGRSNTLGKPVAHLLLRESCTVTFAHSQTRDLPSVLRHADIVVAALGRPNFIVGDWIKPGAVVMDMGANLVDGKLMGDVDFDSVVTVAGAINRPTNAIGPMTIALLFAQTVHAAMTGLPRY